MNEKQASGSQPYDVAVVGGGMVGSAAAVGLAQQGLRVALVEANMPPPFAADQPPDLRVSAINLLSQSLLQSLGAWRHVEAMRVHPYRRLAVWEDGAECEFSCRELNRPQLGYFVENRLLQLALHQRAAELDNLDLITRNDLQTADFKAPCLTFANGDTLACRWLVAADGAQSAMRQKAGIGTRGWPYRQQVLAITVRTRNTARDITWQQFSPTGPMAFLPLHDGCAELIWYHGEQEITRLKGLSAEQLKAEIETHFPPRLGEVEVLDFASFPIQRLHAKQYYRDNMVLLGDAAHCINPLAGQGVNLGFKDVSALLELVRQHGSPKSLPAAESLFKRYQDERRVDNRLMMTAMDALYVTFSNRVTPLRQLRNLGLKVAGKIPLAKTQALKYAAGLK